MQDIILKQIIESIETKQRMLDDSTILTNIEQAAKIIIEAYRNGHKVLLAGNGGSAADAQHIAGELVSRFYFDRPGLSAIALTTDSSILTAIGNDYGYRRLFSRRVQAQATPGDVFIGISTSGNSENIIEALETCKQNGIRTIGFCGKQGGNMESLCDVAIKIPSTETPRIQESHILIGHVICCLVEDVLFSYLKPIK